MESFKIESILNQTTKLIDPMIEEILTSYVDEKNQEVVKYQILTGGKRLRPALAILSCQLLNGKLEDVLYPAAGLEILHNYSLIVDDIIDKSILRRGKPTVWTEFGKSIAECIGVDYSAAIFQAAIRFKKPVEISEIFTKIMKTIADGEILDILFEQRGREEELFIRKNRFLKITDKDYMKMISKKTAFLFRASGEVGGICAKAKKREIRALKNYGLNLGIAFQVRDDILDIFRGKEGFGKDIKERKLGNIVILKALKEFNQFRKKRFLEIMRKEKIENKDIEEAIKLIKETNALQKANLVGESFVEKAKKELNFLPKNKWNNILRKFADFAMERKK